MKRLVLLIFLFLLAACSSSSPASEPEMAEPAAAGSEEQTAPPAQAVSGNIPAATVAEAAVVRERDHVAGATVDPVVTIIEYGDFQ